MTNQNEKIKTKTDKVSMAFAITFGIILAVLVIFVILKKTSLAHKIRYKYHKDNDDGYAVEFESLNTEG